VKVDPSLLAVAGSDPEREPQLVDGAVEHHVVIGHVEMAIVVDPLRLDLRHRCQKRRGPEQRIVPGVSGGSHRHQSSPLVRFMVS
jgi:hypothetical protein